MLCAGTLIRKLVDEFPAAFGFCVSHTSRAPRPGETDGVAYHFSTLEAMQRMQERGDQLYTSAFAIGEILIGPKTLGDIEAIDKVRSLWSIAGVEIIPFDAAAGEIYSDIRANHRVTPADAIHLACAASAGVDLFLTNDNHLKSLIVPGIHFIADMNAGML